jgi:hypothetical protein
MIFDSYLALEVASQSGKSVSHFSSDRALDMLNSLAIGAKINEGPVDWRQGESSRTIEALSKASQTDLHCNGLNGLNDRSVGYLNRHAKTARRDHGMERCGSVHIQQTDKSALSSGTVKWRSTLAPARVAPAGIDIGARIDSRSFDRPYCASWKMMPSV